MSTRTGRTFNLIHDAGAANVEIEIPPASTSPAFLFVTGAVVRTIVAGGLERDKHTATWNGRDDHGRALWLAGILGGILLLSVLVSSFSR